MMSLFTVVLVLMVTPDTLSPVIFHVIAPTELQARKRVLDSGYVPSKTPHCVVAVFADHVSSVFPRLPKEAVHIKL